MPVEPKQLTDHTGGLPAHPMSTAGTVQSVEPSRLLVIEDDTRIGSSLTRALEGSGYLVTWTQMASEAIRAFNKAIEDSAPFHLVLLDLGLPDADGFDTCRMLVAADPLATIIILTARDEELDSVIGLDAGAIDYVTKPFKLSPLLARIRAQLRRSDQPRSGEASDLPESAQTTEVAIQSVRLNRSARRVMSNGVEVALRPKEFDLLSRLAHDAGSVVTRETLMDDVWDTEWFGSTKTLDFHIAALRTKLDPTDGPSLITTIRGVGFRLEN